MICEFEFFEYIVYDFLLYGWIKGEDSEFFVLR